MMNESSVRAWKTGAALRGEILALFAWSAFACAEVSVEPVAPGGSAGSSSSAGSSGSAGRGGSAGTSGAGTGGTSAEGGAAGLGGTGGTGGSSGATSNGGGANVTGPVDLINPDFEAGLLPWTMIAQAGNIYLSSDCGEPDPVAVDAGATDAGAADPGDAGASDAGEPSEPSEPELPHGLQCGRASGRLQEFHGPAYPLNDLLAEGRIVQGQTYDFSIYGRIGNASSSQIKFSIRVLCSGKPTQYTSLTPGDPVTDTEWLFLRGQYRVPSKAECTLTDIRVYLEGPPGGVDIYVDDLSMVGL